MIGCNFIVYSHISQVGPCHPGVHVHIGRKVLESLLEHVAPLRHGLASQGSVMVPFTGSCHINDRE